MMNWHLESYVGCHLAADSGNEDYLGQEGAVTRIEAELSKLKAELSRRLKKGKAHF